MPSARTNPSGITRSGSSSRCDPLKKHALVRTKKEYDFSAAKPNPYAKRLKKAVTIRLEPDVISYFKALSSETHVPYQNLINLYLLDCAREQKRISMKWEKARKSPVRH